MISDLFRAFAQLSERPLPGLLVRCLLLALLVFVLLSVGLWFLLEILVETGWTWVDALVPWAGAAVTLVLAWFLFPAATIGITGFFLDDVAEAVERKHYAHLPPGRAAPFWQAVLGGVRLGALALLLNLLVLPLYLIPGVNLALYAVLNGYLLGREYFEMAAGRRIGVQNAALLRRRNRGRVFANGVVLALLFAVPFLNLAAPIIGAAFMVHRVARIDGARSLPQK